MTDRTAFYIQKYVMRGNSQVTTPIIPPASISFILQAQPVTKLYQMKLICNEWKDVTKGGQGPQSVS